MAKTWKEQVIEQYSDVINQGVDDFAILLRGVLDDRMAEKLADAAERFASKLRQKDEPLQ